MKTRKPGAGLYLEHLPTKDRRKVISAIKSIPQYQSLVPSNVHEALEHHHRTGIPLRLALEAKIEFGYRVTRNPMVMTTMEKLKSSFRFESKEGTLQIRPSLAVRTTVKGDPEGGIYGLHHFTALAFRVLPPESEMKRFNEAGLKRIKTAGSLSYLQLFEVGFAQIGKQPVIVVTNAQAHSDYYSLPWKLRKMFKGAYENVLEEVQRASGGIPVLIPSNKTVKEMIASALHHTVPDHVLDEFYDRFSEKRGRRKVTLTIKNPADKKDFTAEFWIKKPE